MEHTYLLYSQVVQVPLVLSAPGRLPEGVRIETPVQLQDLYATLLDLALGQESDASLRPLAQERERASTPRAIRSIAYPRTHTGIEKLRFAYRYYREGDDAVLIRSDGAMELYDLGADSAINEDLAAAQRAHKAEGRVSRMTGVGWPGLKEKAGHWPPPTPASAASAERFR